MFGRDHVDKKEEESTFHGGMCPIMRQKCSEACAWLEDNGDELLCAILQIAKNT